MAVELSVSALGRPLCLRDSHPLRTMGMARDRAVSAGMVVKRQKTGFGRFGNLGVGLVGALIGGALVKLFSIDLGLGNHRFPGFPPLGSSNP